MINTSCFPCVAQRVGAFASLRPDGPAVIEATGKDGLEFTYKTTTFAELDLCSERLARGLMNWGVAPKMKLALLVPYSAEFIVGVLGLLRAGTTVVLIDPGMGRANVLACLSEIQPDGFVAIPSVQAVRSVLRHKFPSARWNVTLGRRWGWGGKSWDSIQRLGTAPQKLPELKRDAPAAMIFTSGSTGVPKGVLYTNDLFNHQVDLIRDQYDIQSGSRDLACFPLFGLFNAVMGVTTVIPNMDATRPAQIDPRAVYDAIRRWNVTQAFGSPALWNTVMRDAQRTGERLPQVRRILSAGAPVPIHVLRGLREIIAEDGEVFTPYGATEALPVASIESRMIICETAAQTALGAGTCVGKLFPGMQWRIIAITDEPLAELAETSELPQGLIGELMVTGPTVTREYVTRREQNRFHKVRDGERIWHRMGDVGYLDASGRFWFCGRKSQRVILPEKTMFTEPCEAILNSHPSVYRSALVGVGQRPNQTAVMVVEPWKEHRPCGATATADLIRELQNWLRNFEPTQGITDLRIYPKALPVDIRHNSKIFRERLAAWAAKVCRDARPSRQSR